MSMNNTTHVLSTPPFEKNGSNAASQQQLYAAMSALQRQNDALKKQVHTHEETINAQNDQIQTLKAKNSAQNDQIQTLEAEKRTHEAKEHTYEALVKEKDNINSVIGRELSQTQKRLEDTISVFEATFGLILAHTISVYKHICSRNAKKSDLFDKITSAFGDRSSPRYKNILAIFIGISINEDILNYKSVMVYLTFFCICPAREDTRIDSFIQAVQYMVPVGSTLSRPDVLNTMNAVREGIYVRIYSGCCRSPFDSAIKDIYYVKDILKKLPEDTFFYTISPFMNLDNSVKTTDNQLSIINELFDDSVKNKDIISKLYSASETSGLKIGTVSDSTKISARDSQHDGDTIDTIDDNAKYMFVDKNDYNIKEIKNDTVVESLGYLTCNSCGFIDGSHNLSISKPASKSASKSAPKDTPRVNDYYFGFVSITKNDSVVDMKFEPINVIDAIESYYSYLHVSEYTTDDSAHFNFCVRKTLKTVVLHKNSKKLYIANASTTRPALFIKFEGVVYPHAASLYLSYLDMQEKVDITEWSMRPVLKKDSKTNWLDLNTAITAPEYDFVVPTLHQSAKIVSLKRNETTDTEYYTVTKRLYRTQIALLDVTSNISQTETRLYKALADVSEKYYGQNKVREEYRCGGHKEIIDLERLSSSDKRVILRETIDFLTTNCYTPPDEPPFKIGIFASVLNGDKSPKEIVNAIVTDKYSNNEYNVFCNVMKFVTEKKQLTFAKDTRLKALSLSTAIPDSAPASNRKQQTSRKKLSDTNIKSMFKSVKDNFDK